MRRFFFEIAYNGSGFHGWQRQKNASTVQQVIEEALGRILREPKYILGCGRTDTGVHASQFFFHMDSMDKVPRALIHSLNGVLPREILVYEIYKCHPGAHARFDAISRTYQYHLTTQKDPFHLNTRTYLRGNFDIDLMNKACELFLATDDFEAFSKSGSEVNNYNCNVTRAVWMQSDSHLIFEVSANRFLRSMVRLMVGTMLDVGRQKITLQQLREILHSRDRSKTAKAAPPDGLYLTNVEYPENFMRPIEDE